MQPQFLVANAFKARAAVPRFFVKRVVKELSKVVGGQTFGRIFGCRQNATTFFAADTFGYFFGWVSDSSQAGYNLFC